MNAYGDPAVAKYKKKNPMTGSSLNLKGYTVGSRAPPMAVSSGSKARFGYGIDNLYGGKSKGKSAAASAEPKKSLFVHTGYMLSK